MRFYKPFAIAAVLLAAQLSAYAGEIAVLRNGFSIPFVRKEEHKTTTRLFTATGFIDVPTADIVAFEKEDLPVAPPVASTTTQANADTTSEATRSATMQSPVSAQLMSESNATNAASVPTSTAAAKPVDIDQAVREASSKHQLDPDFVTSVIKAESNFHPHAVSPKGAQGLMQLMPQTASKLGVADPFDPKANIEAGTAHLSALMDLYHNDAIKALAAYNAGAHRVDQYHGVPPYRETRAYVAKIVRDFNAKKRAEAKANAAKAPAKTTATKASGTNATNTKASAASAKAASPKSATKKKATPGQQEAAVVKTNKPA